MVKMASIKIEFFDIKSTFNAVCSSRRQGTEALEQESPLLSLVTKQFSGFQLGLKPKG